MTQHEKEYKGMHCTVYFKFYFINNPTIKNLEHGTLYFSLAQELQSVINMLLGV